MDLQAGNSSSNYDRSSSWRNSFPSTRENEVEESDEEIFTVPDMEVEPKDAKAVKAEIQQSSSSIVGQQRRRGRNPADREYRRLKRLLRNRVSAQQARERKKVYVNDLESKAKELQDQNSKLEEKISILINENSMLRKVLMNTRSKPDESIEPLKDLSGNS